MKFLALTLTMTISLSASAFCLFNCGTARGPEQTVQSYLKSGNGESYSKDFFTERFLQEARSRDRHNSFQQITTAEWNANGQKGDVAIAPTEYGAEAILSFASFPSGKFKFSLVCQKGLDCRIDNVETISKTSRISSLLD